MKKIGFLFSLLMVGSLLGGSFAGSVPMKGENPVHDLIRILEVGKPVNYGKLTVLPVFSVKIKDKTKYVTLEDALKYQWIEITEVEGGRVPQVRISNRSKHMIYLMGGEILTGCKQDRILAADVLLASGTKNLLVPVFCVEQGRWHHNSQSFYTKGNLGTHKLRAKAQEKAPESQSKIWSQIDKENRQMEVTTRTGAYQAAYDKMENKAIITKIEKEMQRVPELYADTIGVVIGLGGQIVSIDIFANPHLFKKQWPKILKSSALSSISTRREGAINQKGAVNFLKSFMEKNFKQKPAVDLGNEWIVNDSAVNANALSYRYSVIHLAGFPQEEERMGVWEK